MKNDRQRGFIGLIITLVVSLALLKYFFDFNIIEILKSPKVVEVFEYLKKAVLLVWNKFLLYPMAWFWNTIMVDLIWEGLKTGYGILTGWVDSQ